MLDHISVDVPSRNNHISIIISKPICGTASFGFLNAYKIIYVLDKIWQGIIIAEIMNRHITQEKKIIEENIK